MMEDLHIASIEFLVAFFVLRSRATLFDCVVEESDLTQSVLLCEGISIGQPRISEVQDNVILVDG